MAELVQKDHGSATGAVKIREWNLFGRASAEGFRKPLAPGVLNDAIVLVGPVVGTVTENTGRHVQQKTTGKPPEDPARCCVKKTVKNLGAPFMTPPSPWKTSTLSAPLGAPHFVVGGIVRTLTVEELQGPGVCACPAAVFLCVVRLQ